MADLGGLDLQNVPDATFEVIPAGDYPVIITEIVEKPTKDGTGARMNCKMSILGGKYQNRVLFQGFNTKNKSAKAELIGRQQFKTIGLALNKVNARTTDEWLNQPLVAAVKIGKDESGNPQNEVSSFKPRLTAAAAPVGTPTAPAGTPAAPVAATAAADPSLIQQAFGEGEPPAVATPAATPKSPW
jgi:hypothetical protein